MDINLKRLLIITTLLAAPMTLFNGAWALKDNNNNKPSVKVTPSPESSKLKIKADHAKYDRKNKLAIADGHVKITQDNVTIYTSEVRYDDNLKTSFIDKFVRIIHIDKDSNRKTDISSEKMVVYHQEKKVYLEKNVKFDREEEGKFKNTSEKNKNDKSKTKKNEREKIEAAVRKERTLIISDKAEYYTKSGDATFTGNAVFVQRDKKASGDVITVKNDENKNTDTVTIDNNAKVIQIRGDWLEKEGVINSKEDKEKERLVKEKLEMTSNKIIIYQKTNVLEGIGNVKIIQNVAKKHREAVGDKAVYDDFKKTMTLTGNVRIKRENEDWLSATKAVFHTDSEDFEAYSVDPELPFDNSVIRKQVETIFTIPDEESPTPEPVIGSSEPFINLDDLKKGGTKSKPSPSNPPTPKSSVSIPPPPKIKISPTPIPTILNSTKPQSSPSSSPTPPQPSTTVDKKEETR
jgi:lipopolysaccharide export system protein LptA